MSKNEKEKLVNSCDEFLQQVKEAFQIYSDLISGFQQNLDGANNLYNILKQVKQNIGEERSSKLRSSAMQETGVDPHVVLSRLQHRNSSNGINYQFAGRMTIVYIYQIWEDHYRKEIERKLKLENDQQIIAPIMGDLRILRNSIIHNKGKATKTGEIINKFSEGDQIEITEDIMNVIRKHICKLVEKLKNSHQDENVWKVERKNRSKG